MQTEHVIAAVSIFIVSGFVCAKTMYDKGQSPILGFIFGLLLFLGWGAVLRYPDDETKAYERVAKKIK
jgi:hypothetical protein